MHIGTTKFRKFSEIFKHLVSLEYSQEFRNFTCGIDDKRDIRAGVLILSKISIHNVRAHVLKFYFGKHFSFQNTLLAVLEMYRTKHNDACFMHTLVIFIRIYTIQTVK